MSQPYKCPVCDGTGKVSRPPHIAGDQRTWMGAGTGPYPCRPCKGEGVLWGPPAAVEPEDGAVWNIPPYPPRQYTTSSTRDVVVTLNDTGGGCIPPGTRFRV